MALKSVRHLPALKSHVTKRATPGEKVLGKLFPNRGAGFPGGWDSDHIKQVNHFVDWTYVAIHTIAMKIASISPNIAWVTDANKPGPRTKRADQRGLLNAIGEGFGGSSHIESQVVKRDGGVWLQKQQPQASGSWHDYSRRVGTDSMCGSGSAFLTMGEYRSKALSVVKPHEELEPVESGHLLRKLVEDPNPVDTHFDYRYELIMFKLLCGAAYEWVIPNAFGRPCERWVIPSHWVWPRTGGGQVVDADHPDADRLIAYYEVRPWGGMGSAGMLKLPPDQVIMHKFKSPVNKLLGYSKLWALSRWIDVEESISNSRFAQMSNQARPEFWVEMPASFNDPDDSMIARWEAKIAQKHQGEFNLHRPLFMPAGAKAQVLSFSPEEMAYFNSEEQIRDMILSGFGVPKSAVGVVSDMTFGSVLATLMSFCEQCINPLLTQEGEVSTKFLASRFDEEAPAWSQGAGGAHGGSGGWRRCRLWYDNCTPADPAQVNSDIQVDLQGHAMTPNMLLALRGRPPYKLGGDNPLVQGPGGLMPLPINVEEKGDDITDLVRRYSESMAADKDVTRLATNEATEDVPKEPSDGQGQGDRGGDAGGGDPAGAAGDAVAEIAEGPKVDDPNGKPAKGLRAWTKRWMAKKNHEFSTTQFNLADAGYSRSEGPVLEAVQRLIDEIDDADLAAKGKEIMPHVTVRYGLEGSDAGSVRQLVETFGPVKLRLGYVDCFEGDEHDVVIVRVDSDDLHRLHDLLGELPNVQTHAEYSPHVALAYVRSGLGQKWVEELTRQSEDEQGIPFDQELSFTGLMFSPKSGTPTMLELASYAWQESGASSQKRSKRFNGRGHADPTFYDECKDLARQVLKDMEIDR